MPKASLMQIYHLLLSFDMNMQILTDKELELLEMISMLTLKTLKRREEWDSTNI